MNIPSLDIQFHRKLCLNLRIATVYGYGDFHSAADCGSIFAKSVE